MLDKIIKDLEKLQSISNVDEESAYFNAIQIIKQHEPQFKEAIEDAYNDGGWAGQSGSKQLPQDYYNQKYKK